MRLPAAILLILSFFILLSCEFDRKEDKEPEDRIVIARFDRLQQEYVEFNNVSAWQKMNTEFSRPTQLLIEDILRLGPVVEPNINHKFKNFYSDTLLVRLMSDVESRFDDLEQLEKELTKGFKNLRQEIPYLVIPRVYTQVSAFNQSVIVEDSLLRVSLDKYMGSEYPLYQLYYYDYQCRTMRPDRIAPDCFTFYLEREFPFNPFTRPNLLEIILYTGKINYAVKQVLGYPTIEEELGYSREEAEWCKKYAADIWSFMVENSHVLSIDPMVIYTYTKPSPYQLLLSGAAVPPYVGIWMGTLIVESFMKKNRKVSLRELLETTNYEWIFNESGFLI